MKRYVACSIALIMVLVSACGRGSAENKISSESKLNQKPNTPGDGLHFVEHQSNEFKQAYMLGPVYYFEPGDQECKLRSAIPTYHSNFNKNEFAVNDRVTAFTIRHWDGRGIFYYSIDADDCKTAITKNNENKLFPISRNSVDISAREQSFKGYFDDAANPDSDVNSQWFSVSINNDSCIKSGSPADYIEDLHAAGKQPLIEDSGPVNQPTKVKVSHRDSDYEYARTYWRMQSDCEVELNSKRFIPTKYR